MKSTSKCGCKLSWEGVLGAFLLAFALIFTGGVPKAVAATNGTVTVTSDGQLDIANLVQSGTILTVVAGGSVVDNPITLTTGNFSGGTLSVGGLIFSGTSAFQDKDVNLSAVSYLQLASGGSLTLPNGMSVSSGPASNTVLLGGRVTLNVGSSATQGGYFGVGGGAIRFENVAATRSTLTVNVGNSEGDNVSAAYLDLGARLDLVKNGRGILGLNLTNPGSLPVFSGTIIVSAGTLQLGDNFLSDGTSNSLLILPASGSALYPVVVSLEGSASVSSFLTSGGSANNVIFGSNPNSGFLSQLVINNVASDNSVFMGVLCDAIDGQAWSPLSVVKNGTGSLLLANSNHSHPTA